MRAIARSVCVALLAGAYGCSGAEDASGQRNADQFGATTDYVGACDPTDAGSSSDAGTKTDAGGATTGGGSAGSGSVATFTNFTASADTHKIYVSSSSGNDANSGLTASAPVKTVAKGKSLLRNGYPDWLLLKKGDSWNESLGGWKISGRSASEPMLVSSYGSGKRPELRTGAGTGMSVDGSGGTPQVVTHLAFVGVRFYADQRDPASPTYSSGATSSQPSGIIWLRGTTDLLVEDCEFQSFGVDLVIENSDGFGQSNVRLRYDVLTDAYSADSSVHSQGMYLDGIDGLLIEDCVLDHNGWNERVPGATATIFNHNMYIQSTNKNVTMRDNVVMRASSNGAQLRPGGTASGNLFVRNAIGLLVGVSGTAQGNVILEGTDITPSLPRGWGLDLANVTSVTISNNIIAHVLSANPGTAMDDDPHATYQGNIVYKWGATSRFTTPGPFVAGERSVATYNASVGGAGTFDDFAANMRAQSRDHWNPAYDVKKVIAYIQAGFQKP